LQPSNQSGRRVTLVAPGASAAIVLSLLEAQIRPNAREEVVFMIETEMAKFIPDHV
jgi:hypothetical protein